MKFGGTSVKDEAVIGRVVFDRKEPTRERPLVVVSALSKVTRMLCELAQGGRGSA